MRVAMLAVLAAVSLASAGQVQASDACGIGQARNWTSTEGAVRRQIEAQVDALRDNVAGVSTTISINTAAECLGRNYGALSGKQQSAVNTGSQITAVSGAGAALAGSAASAFGYAAFTPILFNQLSALEPKRNLYAGAQIGVDRINQRHSEISRLSGLLVSAPDKTDDIRNACDRDLPAVFARAPAIADQAHRTVVTAEVQRLQAQCGRLRRVNGQLALLKEDLSSTTAVRSRQQAIELLNLHDSVTQRHRELLYTPAETFAVMLATPFRAVDQLLTGDGGQKSVDQVQTQRALEGLGQTLTPFGQYLTKPTFELTETAPAPPAFAALSGVQAVNADVSSLLTVAGALDGIEARQRRDLRNAQRLFDAVERTQLRYAYSTTGDAVTVSLEPPSPVAPAVSPAAAR